MTRNLALKIVNPVMGLLLIMQFVTAIWASQSPGELPFELHEWGGWLLGACVVLHVILNWNWIKANFFPRKAVPSASVPTGK